MTTEELEIIKSSLTELTLFIVNEDTSKIQQHTIQISAHSPLSLYPVELTQGNLQSVLWRADLPSDFVSCPVTYKVSYSFPPIGTHRVENPFTRLTKNYVPPGTPGYDPERDSHSIFMKPEHILSVFSGASDGQKPGVERSMKLSLEFVDLFHDNPSVQAIRKTKKRRFGSPRTEYATMPKFTILPQDPFLRVKEISVKIKINDAYISAFEDLASII